MLAFIGEREVNLEAEETISATREDRGHRSILLGSQLPYFLPQNSPCNNVTVSMHLFVRCPLGGIGQCPGVGICRTKSHTARVVYRTPPNTTNFRNSFPWTLSLIGDPNSISETSVTLASTYTLTDSCVKVFIQSYTTPTVLDTGQLKMKNTQHLPRDPLQNDLGCLACFSIW